MMNGRDLQVRRVSMPLRAGAGIALAAALVDPAAAQGTEPPRPAPSACAPATGDGALECAFWACDYAATIVRVAGTPAGDYCSAVTEEFKSARFGGDFEAMLAWWREHKPARHGALAAARRLAVDVERGRGRP